MKTEALGRGKPKDAYDIYCVINSYPGGVLELVKEFVPYMQKTLIQNMCVKLDEKFASPDHAGPADIVAFLDIKDEEEKSLIKQDAFQKIHYLTDSLRQH
jgi:hypothetical protein